ncbi:MAG TPA: SPOR domain-containing protein, partial [Noviherbaspirillum sp.]|nr:SPOR domain-containing protein [Noviherbaspirillum sp.]
PAPAASVAPASPPAAPAARAPAAVSTPSVAGAPPVGSESPARSDDGARALALLEGRADPRTTEKKAEKFVIQVAALASQEKVNELQGRLAGAGIKSFTQKVATESGERTRVRVGPFASRDEAEKMRERIVKMGLNGTLVPA